MKKTIFAFVMFVLVGCISNIYSAEYNGYIVKTKHPMVSMFSLNEDITKIGFNLYHANALEDIEKRFSSSNIEGIIPNVKIKLYNTDYPEITSDTSFDSQWYLEKIGAVSARQKGLTGKGVKVAVIDSGINKSHLDFNKNNILQGYKCMYIQNGVDENDNPIYDEIYEASDDAYTDVAGHGTMVSGIISAAADNEMGIAGIANNAAIIPIKVTDTDEFFLDNLFSGLYMALVDESYNVDCDIINLSVGFIPEVAFENSPDSIPIVKGWIQEYIDYAEDKGVVIVAAAGNEGKSGTTYPSYPAGADKVIAVGSVGKDLSVSDFSQKNDKVFLTAPGEYITSLLNTDTIGVKVGNGTSFSAPIVTAAVALIKEAYPDITPKQVRQLLAETCVDYGDAGKDTSYGYGILSIENIVDKLSEMDKIPNIMITQGKSNSIPRIYIHNNSNNIVANGYFAKYDKNTLENSDLSDNINIQSGVNYLPFEEGFDTFFLWDNNFIPYAKKYLITE